MYSAAVPPNSTPDAIEQRDLLVSYLNQHKPARNGYAKVKAVAVSTMNPQGLASEARRIGCEYTVMLSFGLGSASLSPGAISVGQPGLQSAGAFDNQSVRNNPGAIMSTVKSTADGKVLFDGCSAYGPQSRAAMSVSNCVFQTLVKTQSPSASKQQLP